MSHRPYPVAVDVREVLQKSVADLYSHLVTRPTGRAVRLAIETQLAELRRPALSLVDLSSVTVLDYSCADEVVAKLLLRYAGAGPTAPARESEAHVPLLGEVFFVLKGVQPHHRDPIEEVLCRHRLAVVAETATARYELLGVGLDGEREIWTRLEERGRISGADLRDFTAGGEGEERLDALLARRLAFRDPIAGDLHALSTLVRPPYSR